MCTYYYLHYHHVAPCSKGVEYAVQYSFCANSTTTGVLVPSPSPLSSSNEHHHHYHQQQDYYHHHHRHHHDGGAGVSEEVQQPCASLTHAPEYDPAQVCVDYTNPCATGGCLLSQHCASGGCRLDELGGRWACCRCGRGGNTFRWCVHRVRKVPDALCYHVVCPNCRVDS
ncbi:hypothetical protein F5X98DRAFT_117660 [Xylaria grammica]|nr:hypothetical protein F5X98DRAFT_117660 [Xylaria grammica]